MEDFSVAQIQEDQLILQRGLPISFSNSNESDYLLNLNGSEDELLLLLENGSSNSSSEGDDYVPYEQRPETYIVPVLFFIIFVIGVLGNGTLIAIFIRHRTMRSIPNL